MGRPDVTQKKDNVRTFVYFDMAFATMGMLVSMAMAFVLSLEYFLASDELETGIAVGRPWLATFVPILSFWIFGTLCTVQGVFDGGLLTAIDSESDISQEEAVEKVERWIYFCLVRLAVSVFYVAIGGSGLYWVGYTLLHLYVVWEYKKTIETGP